MTYGEYLLKHIDKILKEKVSTDDKEELERITCMINAFDLELDENRELCNQLAESLDEISNKYLSK